MRMDSHVDPRANPNVSYQINIEQQPTPSLTFREISRETSPQSSFGDNYSDVSQQPAAPRFVESPMTMPIHDVAQSPSETCTQPLRHVAVNSWPVLPRPSTEPTYFRPKTFHIDAAYGTWLDAYGGPGPEGRD